MRPKKEKPPETQKGKNPPGIFNRGYLAKVRRQAYQRERETLTKTSLKDLMGKRSSA
jgi:hypothetical protein